MPISVEVGETLSLEHISTRLCVDLLAEPVGGGGAMLLARPGAPYDRLQASDQSESRVVWRPTMAGGKSTALWLLQPLPADTIGSNGGGSTGVRVRVCAAAASQRGACLTLDNSGALTLHRTEDAAVAGWMLMRRKGMADESDTRAALPSLSSCPGRCEWDRTGCHPFAQQGFVVLPGLIGHAKVQRALRYMNHHLGSADLASDLEPHGLGVEFMEAAEELQPSPPSGASDPTLPDGVLSDEIPGPGRIPSRPRGVVKLGGGRRCTCSLSQAKPLLELLGSAEREAILAALPDEISRGRKLSGHFGCQVALRFPLAPFADGVSGAGSKLVWC
jgi:hypothetical protein